MSFRLGVNEKNEKVFIQQQNYIRVINNTIKVRHAFSEGSVYELPYIGRIIDFIVPSTGLYKIEAWGARGGSANNITGPLGAYSKSYVILNKGEIIQILVGEKGYPGHSSTLRCGGGGGGTFIAKGNVPLCVAGGGGSFAYTDNSYIHPHACGQAAQQSVNFGTGQASVRMGGLGGSNGGGGGGFEGNGYDGTNLGKGGNSFLSGGARQTQGTNGEYAYGGFGGGGSRHGNCGYAAGGGGYTGGSASENDVQGGGGGSYFEGSFNNETSIAISGCDSLIPPNPGTNGNGFAILTLHKSYSDDGKASCYCNCYKFQFPFTMYAMLILQNIT